VAAEGAAGFTAKDGVRMRLAGDAGAQGAWIGLGAPLKADDPTIAAAKRLLGRFDFKAPGVQLAVEPGLSLRLTQPARLTGPGGGLAVISPRGGSALFAGDGGAFNLALRDGGLPTVEAGVPRYTVAPSGAVTATVASLAAKGSLGPLIDADLKTSGRFSLANEVISFAADKCSPVTVARLEMGENDVDTVSGELCPTKDPILTLNGGAWRVRARAGKMAVNAPFLEAKIAEGAGVFDLAGKDLDLKADATIETAQVTDVAAITRFNPVLISGTAVSRAGDWTADLAATDLQGRKLGTGHLVQTLATKSGTMSFDTGQLTFEQGGLQPAALSPMAAPIASPVTGRARFVGQVGWVEGSEEITGGGTLDLTDVGFKSPAGALTGANGRIVFTSLVPALVTAPDQKITVAKVQSLVPLTDIAATVSLDAKSVKLADAQLAIADGHLRLDPITVPLDGSVWEGRLHVDGVQLSHLIEASPFADRVDVDAKVSGDVPFTITPEGLRIAEGKLAADQPGRISIRREALTNVAASGGAAAVTEGPTAEAAPAPATPAPPPNTVADFAYQAMENLAFDHMDVTLNSLPGGRLGGLFHISGRHDPPKRQTIRLSLVDLITRRFLQRELPLPSGTEVNLTLDSSVNLDDVLRDVLSTATSGSASVQP
ncbi:MAG: YdbH domain-containing protein, partial [Caulobacterales bacterium]|nr:YdbH domain-containing protein [Caulobacterales bacterium]